MFRILRVNGLRAAGDDSATDEFADAGEDEVGYVSDVYAVECCCPCDAAVDREEKPAPADSPQEEGEGSGGHGKEDELPAATFEALGEVCPFDPPEGEPEEDQGEGCGDYVFYDFSFH